MFTGKSMATHEKECGGIFYFRTAKSIQGYSLNGVRKAIHTRTISTGESKLEAHLEIRGQSCILDVAEMQPDSITLHISNVFVKIVDKNYKGTRCTGCWRTTDSPVDYIP